VNEVLDYLKSHDVATARKISEDLNRSRHSVEACLRRLRSQGYVSIRRREKGKSFWVNIWELKR